MTTVYGSPFRINWNDREAVVQFAERLGTGMTVFKHPDRNNYNITHTSRTDRYEHDWIIHQT